MNGTGFIRTEKDAGVWWLVDPGGKRFASRGVNHVAYAGDASPKLGYSPYGRAVATKHGSAEAWARAAVARLKGWGFNTIGAGEPVQTQRERADRFEEYVIGLMKLPYAVGYHWFQYSDQPAEGRNDGENSNYGVVDGADEPWEVLTARMQAVNARAEAVHAGE